MKTRFDENVARDIPVTKNSAEPELPWKMAESEMSRIESTDEKHKAAISSPPLQARAVFVVLLVITIFVFIMNHAVNMTEYSNRMRLDVSKKEKEIFSIKTELDKTANEKAALSDTTEKLEKKVSDLSAQKELYTAVIDTLTKKTDETQAN